MMDIAILIPAYNPDEKLLEIIQQLLSLNSFKRIVVVNDGSQPEYERIFAKLADLSGVDLLTHAQNQGKGAALKTGLRHLFTHFQSNVGVVTVDADGQHAIEDILHVAAQTNQHPQALTLGERQFDHQVPWKSRYGNQITLGVLRLFFGINLQDSQTGLRGIPWPLIPMCLDIPYDRYEFELELLLVCKRGGIPFHQVNIQTIYFDQNRATHFNPIKDSSRIYFVLFRYTITSLVTALTDYLVFFFAYLLLQQILVSTLLARSVALIVNYLLVRNAVFHSKKKASTTFPRYVLLVFVFGLISAGTITLLHSVARLPVILAKALVETPLFLIIFQLQKGFVFLERVKE